MGSAWRGGWSAAASRTSKASKGLAALGGVLLFASCASPAASREPRAAIVAPPAALSTSWRYLARPAAGLEELTVTVCFDGPAPERLVPGDAAAADFLREPVLLHHDGARPLPFSEQGVELPATTPDDACVRYGVELRAGPGGGLRDLVRRVGDDVVLAHGLWLWRPARYAQAARVTARFSLPGAMRVSSPWGSADADGSFHVPTSTLQRRGYTALGRLRGREIPVPGGALDVVLLDAPFAHGDEAVYGWLEEAGRAVATLYGRFPRERVQVLVQATRPGERVHFGWVVRGGGPSVSLLLGGGVDEGSLSLDHEWIAVHEMSHLAIPYVFSGEPWLSEGLATWYQNALRARAGAISEEQAWESLLAGFDRGRQSLTGRTLLEDGRGMHETGAYQRVYWAGTALVLLADVTLRQESGGEASLDKALFALAEGGIETERGYEAVELCSLLDEASGSDVFTRVLGAGRAERGFPDVESALTSLGVSRREGRVVLDDKAPLASVRRALMGR
jgi:hypothetical protein